MEKQISHYEILEIEPYSSLESVKKAFRELSLKCHPDKCDDILGEKFITITKSYRFLTANKDIYDNLLRQDDVQYYIERATRVDQDENEAIAVIKGEGMLSIEFKCSQCLSKIVHIS